jgi:hypothetical protein
MYGIPACARMTVTVRYAQTALNCASSITVIPAQAGITNFEAQSIFRTTDIWNF